MKPFQRNLPNDLENLCPTCGKPAIMWCRCMNCHSQCEDGHKWHMKACKRKEMIDGRMHVVEVWYEWELDYIK